MKKVEPGDLTISLGSEVEYTGNINEMTVPKCTQKEIH